MKNLLQNRYKSIFIVTVDNVSSQQMHKIRKSLRSEGDVQGVVLMGKNTMVRCGNDRLWLHTDGSASYDQYADC